MGSPSQAVAAGYRTQTFAGDFAKIDLANSKADGFDWYIDGWFGAGATDASNINVTGGVLMLGGGVPGPCGLMSGIARPGGGFLGKAFGSGAYFEAAISIDPSKGTGAAGFPAWWSESERHIIGTDQWAGQPAGYVHFGEMDFAEFYHDPSGPMNLTQYLTAVHDWSGVYVPGAGFPHNIANLGAAWRTVPQPVDWTAFNRYGLLWVPQVKKNAGYVQHFFNDTPGPQFFWKGPANAPPLSGQDTGDWTPTQISQATSTYSVFDQEQFAVTLTTDPAWPMQVQSVKVWQR